MATTRGSVFGVAAVAAVVTMTATVAPAAVASVEGAAVDRGARLDPTPVPIVDGPVRTVAFVGDSILADARVLLGTPPEFANDSVPLVTAQLRQRLGPATPVVLNHAVGGLAIKYPVPGLAAHDLRAELRIRYAGLPPERRPDLVVLGTSSIDLHARRDPVERLAPLLVEELRAAVADLEALGIEAIVLPAVPVNDRLLDRWHTAPVGLSGRIGYLNELLERSGLPMLFAGFPSFDVDGDGIADPDLYEGFSDRRVDDGIHLNRAGQHALADTIAPRLATVIERCNRRASESVRRFRAVVRRGARGSRGRAAR